MIKETTADDIRNASDASLHSMVTLITDPILSSMFAQQVKTLDLLLCNAGKRITPDDLKSCYAALCSFVSSPLNAKIHPNEVKTASRLLTITTELSHNE